MVVDGLLLMAFARNYLRLWRVGPPGNPYRRVLDWLVDRPPWVLRAAGAAEAGLGIVLVGKAPLDVRALYAAVVGLYDAVEPAWRDRFYRDAHHAFDQALATHLPPNGRVLDSGCGTGANLARLLEMEVPFGAYVGVDLSEAMLARAERKWGDLPNVTFRQLDLMADPLPEGPFDLVTSTWVLEHLADPAYVVQQAWDRLRPGGHVLPLFEISSSSWRSRLWNRALRFFSAQVVPQEVTERFPGGVASDVFPGPFGDLALIVLHKPSLNEQVAE
jgi:SAM-dependent methyltransferase